MSNRKEKRKKKCQNHDDPSAETKRTFFGVTTQEGSYCFSKMSSVEHISRVRRLYKLIFRVHRALPPELRVMGDNYARDEFKRHKKCNPEEARIFLNEWTDYAITLAKQMKPLQQVKKKAVGTYLDPQLLDHMTDEQIAQLYELHKAAIGQSETDDNQHSENK